MVYCTGNSSQNGNNNNSALNMADSVNAKSVDNSENSHTILSINKHGNVLLQTARGIIINKENQNLKRNIRILFDPGSQKSFINESLSKELRLPIRREKGFEDF